MKFLDTDYRHGTENRGQTKWTQYREDPGNTEQVLPATLAGYQKAPTLHEDTVQGIQQVILTDTETAAAAATGIPNEIVFLDWSIRIGAHFQAGTNEP